MLGDLDSVRSGVANGRIPELYWKKCQKMTGRLHNDNWQFCHVNLVKTERICQSASDSAYRPIASKPSLILPQLIRYHIKHAP